MRARAAPTRLAAMLVGAALVACTGGPGAQLAGEPGLFAEVMLHADRDQLFRVLVNLGQNAVQALADGGGLISIGAWQAGDETVIELADTGKGIAEAARSHLFEAFSGSTRPGGTGLGLPIAREIMRAHGGDIELAHSGEDGTAFRLGLPPR